MKNLNFIGYPLYAVSRDGRIYSEISKRFLKSSLSSTSGACRVNLRNSQGPKTREIHVLVALAYLPNSECFPVVNHIDGDRSNNDVSNLEWCTHEHNTKHAVATGLMKVRSLDIHTVHTVLSMMEEGYRNIDIAEITDIAYAIIGKIRQGENYRDLWEQYNIPRKSHTVSVGKAECIIKKLNEGLYIDVIAKDLKISRCLVKDIRDGKRFHSLKISIESVTTIESTPEPIR